MRKLALCLVLSTLMVACQPDSPETPVPSAVEAVQPEKVTYLDLQQRIAESEADVVVVNYWATWCVPCKEEFPELVQFGRDYAVQGVEVLFVSADFEEDLPMAVAYLEEQGVDYPTYQKAGKENDFINGIHPDWSGAIPATFVYDRNGALKHFWQEKITYDQLKAAVAPLLS